MKRTIYECDICGWEIDFEMIPKPIKAKKYWSADPYDGWRRAYICSRCLEEIKELSEKKKSQE